MELLSCLDWLVLVKVVEKKNNNFNKVVKVGSNKVGDRNNSSVIIDVCFGSLDSWFFGCSVGSNNFRVFFFVSDFWFVYFVVVLFNYMLWW